jgi:hypothetical protein
MRLGLTEALSCAGRTQNIMVRLARTPRLFKQAINLGQDRFGLGRFIEDSIGADEVRPLHHGEPRFCRDNKDGHRSCR